MSDPRRPPIEMNTPRWRQFYDQNPFLVLGIAAGVGYILGGGLKTPFTARLARVGTRAFVLPRLLDQVDALRGGDGGPGTTT